MGVIKVLDKEVAELIAAGEVVERPASIVKELVENSIDAGASKIVVEIKGGGIKYIRISDDGCGIAREDIKNAFIRHATSKVSTQNDLENIMTFGFRGEALASIAAMCQVELITRTKDEVVGSKYIIEGAQTGELFDTGCPVGTTIIIKNVFFNTPARLKFLKKDSYEGSNIASVLEKLAMINTAVSFKFVKDGNVSMHTPGNNDLKSSIHSIMGSDFSSNSIPVDYNDGIFKIQGYITVPTSSRATRAMENFYINSRFVKSKACMAAIEEAYKGSVMVGKFPGCVLNIIIPPNTVDVNVHPAKTEVRFSDENAVYNAVYNACKFALQKLAQQSVLRSEIAEPAKNKINEFTLKNFDYTDKQSKFTKEQYKKPREEQFHLSVLDLNTHSEDYKFSPKEKINKSNEDIPNKVNPINALLNKNREKLQTNGENITKDTVNEDTFTDISNKADDEKENYQIIGEAFATYIIAQKKDTLILVDKHAAHERYLYNQLKKAETFESQMLIEPIIINVERNEHTAIIENSEKLKRFGFLAEDMGGLTVAIREIPTIIPYECVKDALLEVASKLNLSNDLTPQIIDNIYHSIACRGAVKANDITHQSEMKFILDFISNDENISYCPHGRPVMLEIAKSKIERMFGRIV